MGLLSWLGLNSHYAGVNPHVSPVLQTAASLVIPAGICAILFLVTHPGRIGVLYGLGMTLIYAAWVAICRALLLERHYTVSLNLTPGKL